MTATIQPTQSDAQAALRSFLLSVLPPNVDVVLGVANRAPEPQSTRFVVMTPMRFGRLETNVDSTADVRFTGSIAPASASFDGSIDGTVLTADGVTGTIAVGGLVTGSSAASGTQITAQLSGAPGAAGTYSVNLPQTAAGPMAETHGVMTVTAVSFGAIATGAAVFGVGVAVPTQVTALGSGAGGTGTYVVSPSQTFSAGTLASGAQSMQQNSTMDVQLDFHSDDLTAGDMAQVVSTVFRDEYATSAFAALNASISPLYADDPRYMPFINESQQTEWRWVVDACVQVNQTVSVPQQYADAVSVTLIDVDTMAVSAVAVVLTTQDGTPLIAG